MASIDSSDEEGEAYPSWLFSRPKKASNAGLQNTVPRSSGDIQSYSLAVSKKLNDGNSTTRTPAVVPKGQPAKCHKENTWVVQKKSTPTKQNHNETLQWKTIDKVTRRGGRTSSQMSVATEQICDENLLADTIGEVVPLDQKSRRTFTKSSYNERLLLETIDEVARGGQTSMQMSVSAKQICEKNRLVRTIDEDLIVGGRNSKLKVKRPSYFSLIAHRSDSSSSSDSENDLDAEDKCEPQELDLQDGSDTDKYEFEFEEDSKDSTKEMKDADSVLLISETSGNCGFRANDSSSDDDILPEKIIKTNQNSVQLKPNVLSVQNMLLERQAGSALLTSRSDLASMSVERNSLCSSNDTTDDLLNVHNSTVGTSVSPLASQLIMPFDEIDSQMRIKLICMELGKNPYNYDMRQPKHYQSNPASESKPISKNFTSGIAGPPRFATGLPPRNTITNKSRISASSNFVSAVGVGCFDAGVLDIAKRQAPTVLKLTAPQKLSSELNDSSSDLEDFTSAILKQKISSEVNKPVSNVDYDSEATVTYEEYSQNESHDAQDTSFVNLSTREQLGYSKSALLNAEANDRSESHLERDGSDPEEDEKNLSQLLASERDIDEQFGYSILDGTDYGISDDENNQSISQLVATEQNMDEKFGYSIPKTVEVSSAKPCSMTTDFDVKEDQGNVTDSPATSADLLSILHNFFANRDEFPAKNATIYTDSNVDISLVPMNLGKSSGLVETDLSKIVGDFFINFNVKLSVTAPLKKDLNLLESLLRILPTAAKPLDPINGHVPSTSRQSSSSSVNTVTKLLDPNDGQVPYTSRQSSSSFLNTRPMSNPVITSGLVKPLDPNDGQVPSTSRQSSSSFVNTVIKPLDPNDGQVPSTSRQSYSSFVNTVTKPLDPNDGQVPSTSRQNSLSFINTFAKSLDSNDGKVPSISRELPSRETSPLVMKVEGAGKLEKDRAKEIDIYLKRKKLLDNLEQSAKRLKKETTYNKEEMSKISFTLFSESTVLSDCSLSDEDIPLLIEPKMDLIPNEIETISIPSSPESGGESVTASRSFIDLCTPIVTRNVPKLTEIKPSKKVKIEMKGKYDQKVFMDESVVDLIPSDEDHVSLKRKLALKNLPFYNRKPSNVLQSIDKSSCSDSVVDLSSSSSTVDKVNLQPYCMTVNKENCNVSTVTSETLSKEEFKPAMEQESQGNAGSTFTTEKVKYHLNGFDTLKKSVGVRMPASSRKCLEKNETCTSGVLESSASDNNLTATHKSVGVKMPTRSWKRVGKNETCTSGVLESSASNDNLTATNKSVGVRMHADSRKRLGKNETRTSGALESSASNDNLTATHKSVGVRMHADSRKHLGENETCTSGALESSASSDNLTATDYTIPLSLKTNVSTVCAFPVDKNETCTNRNDKVSYDIEVSSLTKLIGSSSSSVPTGSATRSEVYAGWNLGEELGSGSTAEHSCKLKLGVSKSSTIPETSVLEVELQPDCSNSAEEEFDPNSTMNLDGYNSDSYMDMDICSPAVPDIVEPEGIPPVVQPLVVVDDGLVIWECPICFEPKTQTTKLAATKCGHLFCESCIRQVVAVHKKCPVCQQELTNNDIIAMAFHGYKF